MWKGAKGFVYLLVVILGAFAILGAMEGCKKTSKEKGEKGGASTLPSIQITDSSGFLFTYKKGDGFETVDSLKKVPVFARGWVRVMDPKGPRRGSRHVYVANLCKKDKKGNYVYQVVTREAFESKEPVSCAVGAKGIFGGKGSGGSGGKGARGLGAASGKVIVYMTSTCPVCAKAIEFLKKSGIPFVAKNINKDPAAASELARKAAAAGFRANGVPIFDVKGKLLRGFNPQALLSALGKSR